MILFTVDPLSKTAGMLSIPRDMWVDIPGFGYGKINTAYALGEAYKVPGGGPAMAAKTVEQFLGVPIQYYARVDFKAFEEFIDEIGGVIITVEEPITLVPINAPKQTLQPGTYNLPGYLALAYARNRKTEGGDVDRAKRQQQVVLAIRDRILEPRVLAQVFGNPMKVYREVASGLQTNLSLDDAVRLGVLATSIPIENIKRGVIDYDMVTITNSPDGLYVFKPIADKIRILRDEIFTTGGPISPAAQGANAQELMKLEGARVFVQNGTYTEGLGARTAEYLKSLGVNVVGTGNADGYYANSTLIDLTGKPYTLNYLRQLFNMSLPAQFVSRFDINAPNDVILIVGDDWARNNPMP
ncbi:MAG: LCP family protein, partial [Anaerolineales bacterium]